MTTYGVHVREPKILPCGKCGKSSDFVPSNMKGIRPGKAGEAAKEFEQYECQTASCKATLETPLYRTCPPSESDREV
ncbi:hypothetical protein D1871_04465 [Nakamurella silvestris]|nr:hypothetical protein D1871_04465 [Nakamurella silvestris]